MAGNFRMVFRRRDLVLPMFGAFLAFSAVSAMMPVLPLHVGRLVDGNHVERAAGIAFGVQGVASTVSAFMLGTLTRRRGYRPVLLGVPPLMAGGYLALWATPSYALLVLILFGLGVLQGLLVPALTALIALRAPKEAAGATFGVVTSVNSFAFSGAPFIGGVLASAVGLRAVFPFCACLALGLVVLCLRIAREDERETRGPPLLGPAPSERPAR
jgi:DHA1 family multidrug resistance protein-like MFS transporter